MDALLLAARAGEAAVDAEGPRGPSETSTTLSSDAVALLTRQFAALQLERGVATETVDETLRSNDALIAELRSQQRVLQQKLAGAQKRAQRERQVAARAIVSGGEVLVTEDSQVGDELIRQRTAFDALRHRSSALRAQVRALDADASAHALALARDDAPLRARILAMERELERADVQRAEADAVGKAYAEIEIRLRAERAGALASIRALEATMGTQAVAATELRGLQADAHRRMATGQRRLRDAARAAASERSLRARSAASRAASAQGRLATAGTALSRERARRDLLAEVAGDLGTSEEVALQVRGRMGGRGE